MNIPMKFSESATSFSMKVEEEGGGFRPNMGEFQVIHDGQNGATFYPIVSEDGVLSWTNDMDLPNPEPVDISGKDGKDGRDGKDGYTPVKDVDYRDGIDGKDGKDGSNGKDGYTPIKGVDYFDGKDGKDGRDGVDGYTPIKGIDYFDGKDGKDGIDGRTPVKGVDYVDGKDGKDGVSATHYWNGTVLTVTSASGTSSADLKGAKGDKGDPGQSIKGDKGDTGQAGYTPVKDKDYFDGKDGYSPTVAVTDISGGHRVTITDKNGAKAFDVMDGKDGQGGGGNTSVQADMAQNDPTQADYVKNRTHWVEGEEISIQGMWVAEQNAFVFVAPLGLELGKTYIVTWDGLEYEGTATEMSFNGMTGIGIGNSAALTGGNTGEPFVIGEFDAETVASVGAYGMAASLDGSLHHEFSIKQETVHKLDPKFYDKLAWVEGEKAVLAECQLSGSEGMLAIKTPFILVVGENYKVTLNGVSYNATAYKGSDIGGFTENVVLLMNEGADFSEGTNFVFYIMATSDGSTLGNGVYGGLFLADASATTSTLAIHGEIIHKIDNKFIDFTPASEMVAKGVEDAKTAFHDDMVQYVHDETRVPSIYFDSDTDLVPGQDYTMKSKLDDATIDQMSKTGLVRVNFHFAGLYTNAVANVLKTGYDCYITFFINDYTIDGVDYSGKEYCVVTIKALYKQYPVVHTRRVPLTDDHINSLIDEKLGVIENGSY